MPKTRALTAPAPQEILIAEMERNLTLEGVRTDKERAEYLGYGKSVYGRRFAPEKKERVDITLGEMVRIIRRVKLTDEQILHVFGRGAK